MAARAHMLRATVVISRSEHLVVRQGYPVVV